MSGPRRKDRRRLRVGIPASLNRRRGRRTRRRAPSHTARPRRSSPRTSSKPCRRPPTTRFYTGGSEGASRDSAHALPVRAHPVPHFRRVHAIAGAHVGGRAVGVVGALVLRSMALVTDDPRVRAARSHRGAAPAAGAIAVDAAARRETRVALVPLAALAHCTVRALVVRVTGVIDADQTDTLWHAPTIRAADALGVGCARLNRIGLRSRSPRAAGRRRASRRARAVHLRLSAGRAPRGRSTTCRYQ